MPALHAKQSQGRLKFKPVHKPRKQLPLCHTPGCGARVVSKSGRCFACDDAAEQAAQRNTPPLTKHKNAAATQP
jgi:hypothetical protein